MKTCEACKQEKDLSEFHRNRSRKDGRQTRCKECFRKYYDENKERILTYGRGYREANPHYWWEHEYKRRATAYGTPKHVTPFTKRDLINTWGNSCVDCDGEWTDIDHIIPVRHGGPHSLENCQPVCQQCNQRRWERAQEHTPTTETTYTKEDAA